MTLAIRLATKTDSNGVVYKTNGIGGNYELRKTNGADMFLTAIVTGFGETGPDVALCAKGEPPLGVVAGIKGGTDLSYDSDNPIPNDTDVLVYKPHKGDDVYCTAKTNSAITKGHQVQADGGFIIDFGYVDGTENTDTLQSVVGAARESQTAATGVEKITLVRWGEK